MRHAFFAAIFFFLICSILQAQSLQDGFLSPPDSAKPHTWWHWMNGNVSKEGITLDLEAMKRVGIGGFQLFQVGTGIPKGQAPYGSKENTELLKFAASEANRLGLYFTMHNCPGWSSSGGPWVTPELSMQMLVMTETTATGGAKVDLKLAQPNTQQNYYRDIYVLAYPTPADSGARIPNWFTKANFAGRGGGSAARGAASAPTTTANAGESTPPIDSDKIVDISQFMKPDGTLSWDAPAGNWTIMRIGHTSTGTQNRPPPDGGGGLECDKFSREAMDFHFDHFFGELFDAIKPVADKHMAGALIDSYEAGLQNWTPKFPGEFKNRTGYEIRNYMPALFGRVVRSLDISERFLWDFRKVQANLMAENYYQRFQELCHQHGIMAFNEPYDPGNFDEMAVGRFADMPMGEFWQNQINQHSIKLVASVSHINGQPIMGAESFTSQSRWTEYPYSLKALGDFMWSQGLNRFIFHRYAMQPNPTALPGMTMGPWGGHFDRTNTWWDHGMSAWLEYVRRGQFMLQQGKFVADVLYFAGEDSPQVVPQRANLNPPVPDGYDYDTVDPDTLIHRVKIVDGKIVLPDGMSYWLLVLPEKKTMTVELAKKIDELVKQGMTLVAPGAHPLNAPTLINFPKADDDLKSVVSAWPSSSLDDAFAKLKIDPDFESTGSTEDEVHYIHRRVGDADVYFVANRDVQKPQELVCTFRVAGKLPEFWDAATGQITAASVYTFVNGRTRLPLHLEPSGSMFVIFRSPAPQQRIETIMKDGQPIFGVENLANQSRLAVPAGRSGRTQENVLVMPAPSDPPAVVEGAGLFAFENGSYSMKDNRGQVTTKPIVGIEMPVEVTGPWHVAFPPNLGAPLQIDLPELISWTAHSDNGVKHFSGTATYSRRLNIPASAIGNGKRVFLDLGRVQFLARVRLNGKDLGNLWKIPFTADITDAAHVGDNDLQIEITNLWPNRLIGDEQQPADNEYYTTATARGKPGAVANAITAMPEWYIKGQPKPPSQRITFTTWHHWSADSPLIDSGLIGPVKLRVAIPLVDATQIGGGGNGERREVPAP